MFASFSRVRGVIVSVGLAAVLAGCPTAKSPSGPPPEYEEPLEAAQPTQMGDAGADVRANALVD